MENTVPVGEKAYFIRYENVYYGRVFKTKSLSKHFLSLPFFAFLARDIKQGFSSLSSPQSTTTTSTVTSFMILAANLITQLACVSGVNSLTSVRETILYSILWETYFHGVKKQVSSVSTNIVLTARKALSLCFSVWWFGNEWNMKLGTGAFMVFFGSLVYTLALPKDKINKSSDSRYYALKDTASTK
jgi:solute carrier family 35 (UDP-xylose/UDP-N-acetylglucosamine transporter), member B4